MKVMMVTLGLNLSGQSVHIRNLGVGLMARGHQVVVAAGDLAPGKPQGLEYFENAGIPVVPIPVAYLGRGLASFTRGSVACGWSLRKTIRQHRPDVVHLHAVTLAAQLQLARLLSVPRAPVLVTTFNNGPVSAKKKKMGRLACKTFSRALGRRVVAVSPGMIDLIVGEIGVKHDLVRVISCCVDDTHYVPPTPAQRSAARMTLGVAEDEVAVCCIARLQPQKNQIRLIPVVAALRRRGLPVRLLLAGDDAYNHAQELHKLVKQEDCTDGVNFLGFQDSRTVFWASDVNALVSLKEAFGLVVIEAAMTGMPSVRSNGTAGECQVTHGKTGLLADAESVESITAELEKLVTNQSYRQQLGSAANTAAREKYSLHIMARQMEEIYQEALDA
jgi:glycosyltransferase involved in cell wall biosynthesis